MRGVLLLPVLLVAACAQATPERQIRLEEALTDFDQALCERMAADFEMTARTDEQGLYYQRNFWTRAVSARGVTFSLGVTDGSGVQRCVNSTGGTVCSLTGPAQVRVQTIAGAAQYQAAPEERVRVSTLGPNLICRPLLESDTLETPAAADGEAEAPPA